MRNCPGVLRESAAPVVDAEGSASRSGDVETSLEGELWQIRKSREVDDVVWRTWCLDPPRRPADVATAYL